MCFQEQFVDTTHGLAAARICVYANGVGFQDPVDSSTTFVGSLIPDLSVPLYWDRLVRYFKCSSNVYVIALIYLDRFLTARTNITINRLNIHRLLLVALVVAVKFHEDSTYFNSYYAQVGGLELQELNRLEREFFNGLNFQLAVTPSQFQVYVDELGTHALHCETCAVRIQNSPLGEYVSEQ